MKRKRSQDWTLDYAVFIAFPSHHSHIPSHLQPYHSSGKKNTNVTERPAVRISRWNGFPADLDDNHENRLPHEGIAWQLLPAVP